MLKLLTPYQFGQLALKNRVVMAPMCMYSADQTGTIQPFHFSHYTARAYGGVSMVITEATSVEARGRISDRDLGIYDDAHVEGLKQLVNAVHIADSKIAIQLAHAGRKCGVKGTQTIAPSAITFSQDYPTPLAMTLEQIHEVVNAFTLAATRASIAGFDGIEIHAAHGYLINQFLSPLSNHRTDEYGGSLVNRTRLLKDILTAVRSVFKGEVWLRMSAEEYAEGGHHIQDTLEVVNLIRTLIAGVNVSSGGVVPVSITPKPGYQLPFARRIRALGVPTIGGGLITTVEQMEAALDVDCDLIYLGRELLLNPYVVLQIIKKHAPERMLKAYQRG
ncbi:MAG: NADPH dehydrogenase, partial [Bacilli bacterium]